MSTPKYRQQIERDLANKEEERKREAFKKRLELARQGVLDFQRHRVGDAVKAFMTYLKILEEFKGIPEGSLSPAHFDRKKDLPELLLISGVYWDMIKLYDRAQSEQKRREFLHYVEKYIVFSKGMPYQPVAAETLRKFIRNHKPVHKDELKNAYRQITGSSCFIATSLIDLIEDETLETLRNFRDEKLEKSRGGHWAVKAYYRVSPTLAYGLDRSPEIARRAVARSLDRIAAAL